MEQRSTPTRLNSAMNGKDKPRTLARDISESLGKLPPQALDLEEAILGSLMLEKNALTSVIEFLRPAHFYSDQHKEIFQAIIDLFKSSEPVDMRTVVAQLRKNGKLEVAGGAFYIAELTSKVSSAANIEYHSRIIIEMAIKRDLIQIASQVHHDAYEDTTDVFDLLDKTERSIFQISESNLRRNYEGMNELMFRAVQELQARKDHKDGLTGIPSGFSRLDRVTSGWQKSDLVIIAGRPGQGKTAFIVSALRNAAIDFNFPVALFSLEMASLQLMNRLISSESELDSDKIKKGNLAEFEWQQLITKTGRLSSAPIFIDDTPALSILELRAKCRRLKAEHNIQLIVVDYLQLMRGDSNGNREQEISSISRALKGIAKELNVPVIALSQLSRAVETRGGDKRPQLSDLRECLSVETSLLWTSQGVSNNSNSRINLLSLNKDKIVNKMSDNIEKKSNIVFRLKAISGRYVDCTANHKILTDHGYVELKNLSTDDSIVCVKNIPEPDNTKYIQESKFIGWMIGNGSGTGYCVPSFITNDKNVANEFIDFVKKKWGFPPKPHKHKCKKVYQYDMSKHSIRTPEGNPVRNWMKENQMWDYRSFQKHIPEWWLKMACNKSVKEMIAGLYETDGSIAMHKNKSPEVQYSTTSFLLANQIIYLLCRIGVVGKLSSGNLQPHANHACYKICISEGESIKKFRDTIKLTGYKGELLKNIRPSEKGSNYNVLSKKISEEIRKIINSRDQGKRMKFTFFKNSFKTHSKELSEYEWLKSDDIFLSRVESIEKLGIAKVFDRHVPGTNNFIANGIVVHNSGAIEQDADIVCFIYRAETYKIMEYEDGSSTQGVMEAIIAKHRNGSLDTVPLKFIGKYTKVTDWDDAPIRDSGKPMTPMNQLRNTYESQTSEDQPF